jgi:hypothetical protein
MFPRCCAERNTNQGFCMSGTNEPQDASMVVMLNEHGQVNWTCGGSAEKSIFRPTGWPWSSFVEPGGVAFLDIDIHRENRWWGPGKIDWQVKNVRVTNPRHGRERVRTGANTGTIVYRQPRSRALSTAAAVTARSSGHLCSPFGALRRPSAGAVRLDTADSPTTAGAGRVSAVFVAARING